MTNRRTVFHIAFVTCAASPTSPGLSACFALIIEGLCKAVAARAPRHLKAVLLVMVDGRLRRLVARFDRLVKQAASGTVPMQRVAAARLPDAARLRQRWPNGFAWLVRLVPEAAVFGCQLQHLLLQPEMVALIAETPRAERMFRPLGRMLAVPMGPSLPKPAKPHEQALPAVPTMARVASEAPAEKALPCRAQNAWPGQDCAGQDPPHRGQNQRPP